VTDTRSDAATALFLLTRAVCGRAPGGPPPPRVLDVLVFARAQVRFRAVSGAAAGARGELRWRVPDAGPTRADSASRDAIFVHGETQPAPPTEAAVAPPTTEERLSAPAAVGSPAIVTRETRERVPRPALQFRRPPVPAAAHAAPFVPTEPQPERDHGDAVVDAPSGRPDEVASRAPVVFGAIPTGAALPFAAPPDVPTAVGLTEALTARRDVADPSASAAQPVPPPEAAPAPPVLRMDFPAPDLPWANPFRLEPPVPERLPTAPNGGAAWRFVPSPARSAAETAVRVADAESGGQHEAPETAARRVAEQPRLRPAVDEPLTAGGLLREVTRDEVVHALAERMRLLARDDRFRLGELR
jgi:hypothetical protein